MSEEKQHSSDSGSDFFSDDTIRLFLLGRLGADEQVRFEERLLLDDEMERRVRRVEYELTDDYSFGRLRIEELGPFAQNFLVTEERQQKLAVSQALRQELSQGTAEAFSDIQLKVGKGGLAPHAGCPRGDPALPPLIADETQSRQSKAPWRLLIPSLFSFDRPVVGFALAFVALLIFGGLVWLVMKSPSSKTQQAATRRQPAPSGTREYAHAPSQTPETTGPATPAPQTPEKPGEPGSSPLIATFLLPKDQRDDGEIIRITIPPGTNDIVRLELSLESNGAATYRAELFTHEGQSMLVAPEVIASSSNLPAKVVLDVPARLLKGGDYQIRLSRTAAGSAEDVGHYYFRALEKQ